MNMKDLDESDDNFLRHMLIEQINRCANNNLFSPLFPKTRKKETHFSNWALSDSRASPLELLVRTAIAFSDGRCLIEHLRRGDVLQLLFAAKIEIHVTLIHLAIRVEILILKTQAHTAPAIFINHLFLRV